jgi:hypothetical protein
MWPYMLASNLTNSFVGPGARMSLYYFCSLCRNPRLHLSGNDLATNTSSWYSELSKLIMAQVKFVCGVVRSHILKLVFTVITFISFF